MKSFYEMIQILEIAGTYSIVSCKDLNNPNFQVWGSLSNLGCKNKKKNKILKMKFNKNESTLHNTLADKAEIKTNFPDAHFWLIRKGSENAVGSPTKNFSPEHIGVKVTSGDLLPGYLYYALQHLQKQGYFKNLSHGTTNLKNIKTSDVANIKLG